jgi:hypothetical protein
MNQIFCRTEILINKFPINKCAPLPVAIDIHYRIAIEIRPADDITMHNTLFVKYPFIGAVVSSQKRGTGAHAPPNY